MIELDSEQRRTVLRSVDKVLAHLAEVEKTVDTATGNLRLPITQTIHCRHALEALQEALTFDRKPLILHDPDSADPPIKIEDAHAGLIRSITAFSRRAESANLDSSRDTVSDPGLLAEIEACLTPYDVILNNPTVRQARPLRIPKAADFLRLPKVGIHGLPHLNMTLEPKFQLLLSPEHLLQNLTEYRRHCEARRSPVASRLFGH